MAVADRPEDPTAVEFVAVVLGVQHTVDLRVPLVDQTVLGVDMLEVGARTLALLAQPADGRDRVDALPEQMAGVEIRADAVRARGLAQLHQGLGVVDQEVRVHLEADIDVIAIGTSSLRLPVLGGDVPLIRQGVSVILRPGRDYPVGHLVGSAAAGQAREAVDVLAADGAGQLDSVAECLVMRSGDLLLGVQRIAVDAER